MLSRLTLAIRALIVILCVIAIVLPTLLAINLVLWVAEIPRKIGSYISFEKSIRNVLLRFLDPQEMRSFRDDMLHIVESELNEDEDWERWGILREIDIAQDEIESRLKDGEFTFSLIGSLGALVVGNIFGIAVGGIVLTIVAISFSFLVAIRIIITDMLSYSSINHRNDPLQRLALLNAWNRGPLFGKGAVAIAILTVFASKGGSGYRFGILLLETIAEVEFEGKDKWRTT